MSEDAEVETFIPMANEDILPAFAELEHDIINHLKTKLERKNIKWYLNVLVTFKKPKRDESTGNLTDEFMYEDVYRTSPNHIATMPEEIDNDMPGTFQYIYGKLQEFQQESSGWTGGQSSTNRGPHRYI